MSNKWVQGVFYVIVLYVFFCEMYRSLNTLANMSSSAISWLMDHRKLFIKSLWYVLPTIGIATYFIRDKGFTRWTKYINAFTVVYNFVLRKPVANSGSTVSDTVESSNVITADDFEEDVEDEESLVLSELRMGNDLSLAYRNIRSIPLSIAKDKDVDTITKLDLTECKIKRLENLKYFQSLECLVLDHNNLESIFTCPAIPSLTTLWCNNNNIKNLNSLLDDIKLKFPNINYLSLMRNPAVPRAVDDIVEEVVDEDTVIINKVNDVSLPVVTGVPVEGELADDSVPDTGSASELTAPAAQTDSSGDLLTYAESFWSTLPSLDFSTSGSPVTVPSPDTSPSPTSRPRRSQQREKVHKYRVAVLARLPTLRILDGVDVTLEEYTDSQADNATEWLFSGKLDKDEDEIWKWTPGYEPPEELLRDSKKLDLMRRIQQELEDSKRVLNADYRELAAKTYWDINKNTVARYCESSMWTTKLNGVPIADAIYETIRWRICDEIPIRSRDILIPGLRNGGMFLCGRSRNERPVLYLLFSKDKDFNHELNAKILLYSFERAIQNLPVHSHEFILIIDMAGFGWVNFPPMNIISKMTSILGKHMPRRLGNVFLLNVSYIVNLAYEMVAMSLAEVTKSKFRFLSGDKADMLAVLSEHIDVEEIPVEYGGKKEMAFDVEEYLAGDLYYVAREKMLVAK